MSQLTPCDLLIGWTSPAPGVWRLSLRDRAHVQLWLDRQITPMELAPVKRFAWENILFDLGFRTSLWFMFLRDLPLVIGLAAFVALGFVARRIWPTFVEVDR